MYLIALINADLFSERIVASHLILVADKTLYFNQKVP
jgi:hypothetical protein